MRKAIFAESSVETGVAVRIIAYHREINETISVMEIRSFRDTARFTLNALLPVQLSEDLKLRRVSLFDIGVGLRV